MKTTTAQLIQNASNLGHQTQVAAFAVEMVTHMACHSLCVWCLDADKGLIEADAYRLPAGGECARCSYTGQDTVLVSL